MAIKTISQFDAATPASNDKILFEQNGEGKSTTVEDLGKVIGINVDLLWTNDSPASVFDSQRIYIDLSRYKLILIDLIYSTTNNTKVSAVSLKNSSCYINYSNPFILYRSVTIRDNLVDISGAYRSTTYGSETADNNYLIPYQIFGVK